MQVRAAEAEVPFRFRGVSQPIRSRQKKRPTFMAIGALEVRWRIRKGLKIASALAARLGRRKVSSPDLAGRTTPRI